MSKTDFALGVLSSLMASILYALGGKAYPHLKKLPWNKALEELLETTHSSSDLLLRTKFVLIRITVILFILWYILFNMIRLRPSVSIS